MSGLAHRLGMDLSGLAHRLGMAGRQLGVVGGDEGDLAVCGAVVEELGALGRDGEERPGPRPAGGPLTGPEVVGDAGRVTGLPGLGLEDNLGRTKSQ